MPQEGYLVVANIAGYEAFLIKAELEHAHSIINDLQNALLDNIEPPLVFLKLEGDAIVLHTPDKSFIKGKAPLEMIENLYCTFAMTLETMYRNSVCPCKACQLMTSLDLSFVMHYGTYSLTEIDGQQELIGSDAVILRELFKSPIADALDIKGSAFITCACADAMELNELTHDTETYSDNYENLGEIKGFVHNLQIVWEYVREQRRIMVKMDDAWLEFEMDLPVCSALAWEYVTEPKYRSMWLRANKVTANTNDKGRIGIGTTYICAHGKHKINQVIIDWRPFEYLTIDTVMPMNGMQRHTTRLTPMIVVLVSYGYSIKLLGGIRFTHLYSGYFLI